MRPVTLTIVAVANSPVYAVDNYVSPSNLGLAVIVTGTITYKVQYTFDDVFAAGYVPTSGNWFDHPTLVGSASGSSNIAYPVSGVRIASSAGTGSAALTVIQSGN